MPPSNPTKSVNIFRRNRDKIRHISLAIIVAIVVLWLIFLSPLSNLLECLQENHTGSFAFFNTLFSGFVVAILLLLYERRVVTRRHSEEISQLILNVKAEAKANRMILEHLDHLEEGKYRAELIKKLKVEFRELGSGDWQMLTTGLYWLATAFSYKAWDEFDGSPKTNLESIKDLSCLDRDKLEGVFKDIKRIEYIATTCLVRLILYFQCSRDAAILSSSSINAGNTQHSKCAAEIVNAPLASCGDRMDLINCWDNVKSNFFF